jgi:predicted PurR-regulated permease PerM
MSIFNYKQRNNIVLVSIIVLACFLLYALTDLFSSILGAIVLFTIFRPFYLWMVEKKNLNGTFAALIIIFISLIVIVIPFLSLSIMVIGKIGSINKDTLPIVQWTTKIDAFTGKNLNQPHFAEDTLQKLGAYAADLFPSILGSAASIIITLLVMYFLMYFMFTQMRAFETGLLKYAPFREQHALKFAQALRDSTYSGRAL